MLFGPLDFGVTVKTLNVFYLKQHLICCFCNKDILEMDKLARNLYRIYWYELGWVETVFAKIIRQNDTKQFLLSKCPVVLILLLRGFSSEITTPLFYKSCKIHDLLEIGIFKIEIEILCHRPDGSSGWEPLNDFLKECFQLVQIDD